MDSQKHPNHVFFRYENRPIFACIFPNLPVMFFPKFVIMTKNTPFFFQILHVKCTPKWCTRVQCLVLKCNPNYVNFWTSLIPPLTFEFPPPHVHSIFFGMEMVYKLVSGMCERTFFRKCKVHSKVTMHAKTGWHLSLLSRWHLRTLTL